MKADRDKFEQKLRNCTNQEQLIALALEQYDKRVIAEGKYIEMERQFKIYTDDVRKLHRIEDIVMNRV